MCADYNVVGRSWRLMYVKKHLSNSLLNGNQDEKWCYKWGKKKTKVCSNEVWECGCRNGEEEKLKFVFNMIRNSRNSLWKTLRIHLADKNSDNNEISTKYRFVWENHEFSVWYFNWHLQWNEKRLKRQWDWSGRSGKLLSRGGSWTKTNGWVTYE